MTYRELMDGIGKAFGLDEFEPDDDGLCMLLGERAVVMFQDVPETGMVLTSSVARHLEEAPTVEFLISLLEANLMWQKTRGSTLSFDAPLQNVMLARYDRLETLTVDGFTSIVTDFVKTLLEWTDEGLEASLSEADPSDEAEPSGQPAADGGIPTGPDVIRL